MTHSRRSAGDQLDVRQDPEKPTVWWVRSKNRPKTYRVQLEEYGTSCTCTHGLNNQGRAHCYHVRAAQELRDGHV